MWVVADCSVELIIVVVARSLSGRGGPLASAEGTAGNLEGAPMTSSTRSSIVVAVVVVLVDDGKRANQKPARRYRNG